MNIRLSIIDRYIGQEIITSWLTVFFVLLLVVQSADAIHLLSWVAEGSIPGDTLLPLLINSSYEFSALLIPLSLLLGVLMAFGRLYKDSEMTAIMSAGMGPMQWYRPLMFVTLPTTALMFFLTLVVVPQVADQRDEIMSEIKGRTEINTLFAGRFNQSQKGNAIFFLESQREDGSVMDHVFYRQVKDDVGQVDIAKHARKQFSGDGRNYMVMEDGTHYEGKPGTVNFKITKYEEYGVYAPGEREAGDTSVSIKSMSSKELFESESVLHKAELHWRITIPVATFIIALLALPLSHTTPRSGRYANLALAIVLYLVYSNLLSVGKTWVAQGIVPLWLGTWWVHGLALLLLFALLKMRGHIFRSKKAVSFGLVQRVKS